MPKLTKFLSTAKLRVFLMLCTHNVDVRTVGFAAIFGSWRAIQGGFLLLAMLCALLLPRCSLVVSDTWPLGHFPSQSFSFVFPRSTFLVLLKSEIIEQALSCVVT